MRKKVLSLMLVGVMTMSLALTGCSKSDGGSSSGTDGTSGSQGSSGSEGTTSSGEDKPYAGVTLKWWGGNAENNAGTQAVMAAATEKLGMEFEVEVNPGGSEGDNILKTRMASGDLPDFLAYNSGSKLVDLNPSRGFLDISDWDVVQKFDDAFLSAVTIDGAIYGAPQSSTMAGAVIYYKPDYEELGLEIPHTWDDFVANCQKLADAGKTPVYFTGGETWATQVLFLGDHYNVMAANPTFPEDYTNGTAKFATTPAATRSWTKYEDLVNFLNADKTAATVPEGNEAIGKGEATHWFILTQQLPLILEYAENPDDIGVFGVPGDDANNHGLTVWEPTSWYVSKDSANIEAVHAFLDFYYSEEALDLYFGSYGANGPSCIKGYELPESVCSAVRVDMQKYFDEGKTTPALEYQSPIKGTACEQMTTAVGLGQESGANAAAMYDEDCKKSAVQLGYDWN